MKKFKIDRPPVPFFCHPPFFVILLLFVTPTKEGSAAKADVDSSFVGMTNERVGLTKGIRITKELKMNPYETTLLFVFEWAT